MNVCVIGGSGYIGSMLVPHLLADGHRVTNFDSQVWGDGHLPESNGHLVNIKADVRDTDIVMNVLRDQDACIWLAGITNNDEIGRVTYAREVNLAVIPATRAKVKFIYASSVAVYGTSNARETDKINPTTLYAEQKSECEPYILSVKGIVVRMASVCGESSNTRFDTTINRMTHDAIKNGVINVNGGRQQRSHLTMVDACHFYKTALRHRHTHGIFNVVGENMTVFDSAKRVAKVTNSEVKVGPFTDARSYSVNGDKAQSTFDWKPQKRIEDAVTDLGCLFKLGKYDDTTDKKYWRQI